MLELFNPAGLRMLEDRHGAVAYGYVAPRVFYARFVGCLSVQLGTSYVAQLETAVQQVSSLAYFADASALRGYDALARLRFQDFVAAQRAKFTTVVFLTWAGGIGPESRAFAEAVGEPIQMLSEPLEFERALCNVAPFPDRTAKDWAHVWQVHAPR